MHGIVFSIYFHIGNCLVFFFYFVINGIYSICNGAFQGVLEATNVPFGGMFSEPDCHDDTFTDHGICLYAYSFLFSALRYNGASGYQDFGAISG